MSRSRTEPKRALMPSSVTPTKTCCVMRHVAPCNAAQTRLLRLSSSYQRDDWHQHRHAKSRIRAWRHDPLFYYIYGACEKTVEYITETTPAKAVKVQYTYPVSDDWLVSEFKKGCGRRRRLETGLRSRSSILWSVCRSTHAIRTAYAGVQRGGYTELY